MNSKLRNQIKAIVQAYADTTSDELRDLLAEIRRRCDQLGLDYSHIEQAAFYRYRETIQQGPCANCSHEAMWHVLDEEHSHFGQCEHPAERGFCKCPGYTEADPPARKEQK